jgi:hypothetical protein
MTPTGNVVAGKRFGRWTVIERAGSTKQHAVLWKCVCDCGTVRLVRGTALKNGKSMSCGCVNYEAHATHGMTTTRQYRIWQGMKTRCTNKKQPIHTRYGAQGVTYDPAWESFDKFWEDMKASYDDELTLERADNLKGYSKENCYWATFSEQNINRRSNVFIKYRDCLLTIADVSKLTGLATTTIYNRKQRGWSDQMIMSIPAMTKFANHR